MSIGIYTLVLFGAAAIAHSVLVALLSISDRRSAFRTRLIWLCASTVLACAGLAVRADSILGPGGAVLEIAITGGWCAFTLYLLRKQRPAEGQLWLVITALLAVATSLICALLLTAPLNEGQLTGSATLAIYARLGLAIIGLLATENLYRNTALEARWHISLLAAALAGMFVYTIVLYADALLYRAVSDLLWAGRGIVIAAAAPLLAITAARNRNWAIDIHVSRKAVFHTTTLIGCGVFLVALAATGEVLRKFGAGWGELAEMTLILSGIAAAAVVATSGSARSRLRRVLADNFYTARYDYRDEWSKTIDILATNSGAEPVQTRVIKAAAEIVDSPSGVLWVKDLDGRRFTWAGSWNQPALTCSEPAGSAFLGRFRDGDWVIEFDDRSTSPEWLDEVAGAWLGVPLAHTGRVIGFIVLARPRAPFKLDRETFDLLRIVARQAAVHLVEEQNARALAESQDLQEFAKRFAFVAHDLKNLASPLQLMLQNAVSHLHDPEFQEDVLATVQAALTRLDNLLRKLRSREARVASELNELIVPTDLLREQVEAIRRVHGPGAVQLECDGGRAVVAMEAGAFRSVLTHLCENAIEASGGQVQVLLRHQPMQVEIEVADRGKGMSPEFIRDKLFHPFGSTKDLGMGIGAYQARELVRAAGGDLVVASRPGTGTRMRISLPCAATQQISRPAERSSP